MAISQELRYQIYERDGWICQICHQPTNRHVRGKYNHADPLGATIDHIHGQGDDSPSNLRCAHRTCNSKRRVKENRGQMRIWVAFSREAYALVVVAAYRAGLSLPDFLAGAAIDRAQEGAALATGLPLPCTRAPQQTQEAVAGFAANGTQTESKEAL